MNSCSEHICNTHTVGDAESQWHMGMIYRNAKFGMKKNAIEAVQWFAKAAQQVHVYVWRVPCVCMRELVKYMYVCFSVYMCVFFCFSVLTGSCECIGKIGAVLLLGNGRVATR